MTRPRLVLADDHQVLLEGLQSLLRPDFDIIGIATDGAKLLHLCRTLKPDLAIADIGMPTMTGMEFAEAIADDEFRPRIIFLTMQDEAELAVRAFRVGVAGYVMKHAASIELITAIREVLAGRTFVSPRITRELVESCLSPPRFPSLETTSPSFTPRQIEVLRLIAQGKTMKEVASKLGISARTAEAHKYQMMERHGVRTVAELIRVGMQNGVIDLPSLSGSTAPFKSIKQAR